MSRKSNRYNGGQGNQRQAASTLDALQEFEDFQSTILPKLRQAIKKGSSAEDIYKMVTAAAAGKIATMALTESDPIKALALCKDILDRSQGKAKESVAITAKYEKLSDQELDSMLATLESKPDEDELQ